MEKLPLLIFGDYGVMVRDPFRKLASGLSQAGGRWSPKALGGWLREELQPGLQRGEIPEEDFWRLLLENAGVDNEQTEEWKTRFKQWSSVYDRRREMARWSEQAELAMLCNSLPEWHRNPLRELAPDSILPSNNIVWGCELGFAKPSPVPAQAMHESMDCDSRPVLYVDADEDYLEAGFDLGWYCMLTDPEEVWMWSVEEWLSDHS